MKKWHREQMLWILDSLGFQSKLAGRSKLTMVWLVWVTEVSRIWDNRALEASMLESTVSVIVFWYTSAWRNASSIQEAAFSTVVVAIFWYSGGCTGEDWGIAGGFASFISEDDSPKVAIRKDRFKPAASFAQVLKKTRWIKEWPEYN